MLASSHGAVCRVYGILQGADKIKGQDPTGGKGSTMVLIWGFPKIRGTSLGVPIIRTIVYWGLYWGTLILGNYHIPWHTS